MRPKKVGWWSLSSKGFDCKCLTNSISTRLYHAKNGSCSNFWTCHLKCGFHMLSSHFMTLTPKSFMSPGFSTQSWGPVKVSHQWCWRSIPDSKGWDWRTMWRTARPSTPLGGRTLCYCCSKCMGASTVASMASILFRRRNGGSTSPTRGMYRSCCLPGSFKFCFVQVVKVRKSSRRIGMFLFEGNISYIQMEPSTRRM